MLEAADPGAALLFLPYQGRAFGEPPLHMTAVEHMVGAAAWYEPDP